MRGRPKKHNKEEAVKIAMHEFWSHGYEACSTENLCRETGLGKGSFYNTFGSKHDLYVETLRVYHERWIQEQKQLLDQEKELLEKLTALLNWAIEVDFQEDSNGCYLINAAMERGSIDPAVVLWSEQHAKELEAEVEKHIEKSLLSGEIKTTKTAKELSLCYLNAYYGLRTLNASMRNKAMAQQIAEITIKNLL